MNLEFIFNKKVLIPSYLVLLALTIYLDLLTSHFSVVFLIVYIAIIWLAVVYMGGFYSYCIALLTAFVRVYESYLNYPLNYLEHDSKLSVFLKGGGEEIYYGLVFALTHTMFCYCFNRINKIRIWLKATDNQLLAREFSEFKKLREFIFRPYLNKNWGLFEKLDYIANHYKLVSQYASILNISYNQYIELAQIDFNDEKLRIIIDRPSWMRGEGEVGLSFFVGVDRVYTVMFLLSGSRDNLKLIVGNVQGDGRSRQVLYKNLTKAMHGLRPRDFLITILKMLAQELACKEILGISDNAHRSNYRLSRAKKLASYDDMWLEHEGIKNIKGGFFSLSTTIKRRTEDEMPSNKRSLYRRRYQMLDDIKVSLDRIVRPPHLIQNIGNMHSK